MRDRSYREGDVLVIRNEGPRGGPAMRELLGVTALIYGQALMQPVPGGPGPSRCAGRST